MKRRNKGVIDSVGLVEAIAKLIVALMPLIIMIGKHKGWF